jgi:DNA-binding NarL/FixJ family response regulator
MRAVLFSDEPLVSEALRTVLQGAEEIVVLQVLENIAELNSAISEKQPDLLLLSLTPEIHIGVIRQLRRAAPNCKIVLWIHSISTELAHQAMEMGVRGILRRTYSAEMIVKGLRKVHEGEMWFDRFLTSSFLGCRKVNLTRREGQLVRLLAGGLKNKEIATALSISEGTVKVYLSRLFEKVGAKDRFELALFSLRNLQGSEHGVRLDELPGDELRVLYLDSPINGDSGKKPASVAPPYPTALAGARRS